MTRLAGSHQKRSVTKATRFIFAFVATMLFGTILLSVSSAHKKDSGRYDSASASADVNLRATKGNSEGRLNELLATGGANKTVLSAFLPQAGPSPEVMQIFAVNLSGNCDLSTPQSAFILGDKVCAKLSGGPPLSLYPRKFAWISNSNVIFQTTDVVTDPQTDIFMVPGLDPNTDYRGVWRLVDMSANDGSVRTEAYFSVSNPALPAANLAIYKSNDTGGSTTAGSNVLFSLWVTNYGPDTATNVTITDDTPANTTFVTGSGSAGPGINCTFPSGATGTTSCTLASLPQGASGKITLVVNVTPITSPGTIISNTATISGGAASGSTPATCDTNCDPYTLDNTATSSVTVIAGASGATCTLNCPDNITVNANTTEGGQRGAHVTFDDPITAGDCGEPVNSTPASGTFFPVGTTVINSTSQSGGGACSFTVTVEDHGTNPPSITCPSNQTVNADSSCAATVAIGTPTTAGDNVTVVGVRSDGKPLYNCDCFPSSPDQINDSCNIFGGCSRRADAPFSTGITTIVWTAISHDIAGPYQTPADEEAHRTGTASCTQTIEVVDVTPPTITAADQTASANASCQAAVPDFSIIATVSDNCACASSDNSQGCVGRQDIRVTQDVAPGTLVGLGPHTIHLSANDGSSNNGGAGNTTTIAVTFTVNDTTAPTFTFVPANVTANTGPGATTCDTVVNPGTATATDNCGSVTITRSPSGNTFPVGTTTITWTAKDGANNTTTATQTVTVIDNTLPTITAPGSVTAYTGPGATTCGTVVDPGTATASDNCPGVTVSRSPSGNTFPVGTTTVVWTATDAHGNMSSANQSVTVIDNTPPAISCQADIIADFNPTVNGAVVTYTAPVGTDNCASTTTQTTGLPSGSTFPTGTTTNTFKVTDASGNTAQCSFKVTVALTSIIGLDSVSISGASFVDSYDSTLGYPASKSSLANVLSNGTITLAGSAKVWGNVRSTRVGVAMSGASQVTGNATAGTTVSLSGSASVGGTKTNNALAPVITLPAVPACSPFSSNSGISGTYSYSSSTGDLTLSGVNIATLANGSYCFHNVNVGGSAQLKVNGPVVIKMTGTLSTSGASSVPNTTAIPSNLQILSSYSGSNGVSFGASSNVHLVIYAPKTDVNISGATPLFGTIAGKTLTVGGSGAIHYDTKLKTIWPAIWTLIFGP